MTTSFARPARRPALSTLTALLAASTLACDPGDGTSLDEDTMISTTDEGDSSSDAGDTEMELEDEEGHQPARPLGPPAPAVDEPTGPTQIACGADDRCAGAVPVPPPSPRNFARSGKHTRGNNSQLAIPQNLILADVDGDGYSDFVQYASNKLFVSKTDYAKTGVLHLYTGRPIKRVLTGDFHGDKYDQTCVITDDNALACYGIGANKHELWWWFTQGAFVGDNEDFIIGDYDGDGRDDILVYPRAGGALRMYSMKGDYFFAAMPAFSQGNMAGTGAGMQLRAGDFNGDGRDDIMAVNPARQVIYYASVFDGTNNTFWWAFTSVGNFVGADEQVTVARVDDNAIDDIALHNRVTGATRFHRLEYGNGSPPALAVTTGQIGAMANSQLFWGFMHGSLPEAGGNTRDDAMVYDQSWNQIVRSDARWDGSKLTYWWNYTQWAPNNHTGWAPLAAKPWLVLKCKFSDIGSEPRPNQFYQDLVHGALVPYWSAVSYGSWDLSGSKVVDAWNTMAIGTAGWGNISRYDRVGNCINSYAGSTAGYVNVIGVVNGEGDAGNAGGRVLATPNSSNMTFLAHETGHTFGWGHSFDDTQRLNSSWSAPGEYFDFWDIMSAMAVHDFAHPQGVLAGPEMNAPYRTKQAFIPAHRITKLVPSAAVQTWRANVAAIHRPEGSGALMVRVGNDDNNYYTVEYRMKDGWDAGIPRATVLVHRVTAGVSYLITAGNGPERLVGSVSSFPLGARNVTVRVLGFAAEGYTADVQIDY